MEILVCVKRVPTVGGAITLTADGRAVDTSASGFTISPHEECAVEEAVRLAERFSGAVTVVSLGPAAADEQLRACRAVGASESLLIETADGTETGPVATAAALHYVATRQYGAASHPFDLVLLGQEASDTGDYQVGIRLAHLLGWPVATAIKQLTVADDGSTLTAARTYRGTVETFTLPLPAVVTVKEGINRPRYPSLPGRLRAKRAAVIHIPAAEAVPAAAAAAPDTRMTRLRVPDAPRQRAVVLGQGAEAVPALVAVLAELGVIG